MATQVITLEASQTTVELTEVEVDDYSTVTVTGDSVTTSTLVLDTDYTITSVTEIELATSYDAGTFLIVTEVDSDSLTDEEMVEWVRFWLGNLTTDMISDDDLYKILDQVQTQYPDATLCQYKYYFARDTLKFLIRTDAADSASTGEESSRKEVRGKTTIEVEYDTDSDSSDTGWESILDDLLADPSIIGCSPFDVETETTGRVILGGGSMSPTMGAICGYRRRQRDLRNSRKLNRSIFW